MPNRLARFLVVTLLMLVAFPTPAWADEHASTFALIVTNNRSPRLSRADLRYADDDGAKYYELFRMFAPESNVALLTAFDADTQKLFPDLASKAQPPSGGNVRATARRLAERIRAAKALGPVDFYFVFAGHGDVEQGKGFLELEDGPFTADDLHALVRSIPATRSHVVLDSCNAFFAIQARKPGGRHFVTSEEAQRSLAERLPNVGVFLSTSAEGNVYEWSSIQSGIFSHAVRSGLAGAADANADGHVTYDELRAFVATASKDVKNPAYRPQVFARGPGGRGDVDLFDLTRAKGKRLELDEKQHRVTIRDAVDVPWFDLHKEAGIAATLVLPERIGGSGSVEETTSPGTRTEASLAGGASRETIALASLSVSPASGDARGADAVFQSLFAQPFGPTAYAKFLEEQKTAAPLVLGVSPDERERMRLLLKESAGGARSARQLRGGLLLPVGIGLGVLGTVVIANSGSSEIREANQQGIAAVMGGVVLGGGLFLSTVSTISLFRPSAPERSYGAFVESLALAPDTKLAHAQYAAAEQALLDAAVSDRRYRTWTRWFGLGLACAGATGFSYTLAADPRSLTPFATGIYATPVVIGGVLFFESLFPTTTERMAELWKNDPSFGRARGTAVRVTPVVGPTGLGLQGTF